MGQILNSHPKDAQFAASGLQAGRGATISGVVVP